VLHGSGNNGHHQAERRTSGEEDNMEMMTLRKPQVLFMVWQVESEGPGARGQVQRRHD
jgi:hypothetical protein